MKAKSLFGAVLAALLLSNPCLGNEARSASSPGDAGNRKATDDAPQQPDATLLDQLRKAQPIPPPSLSDAELRNMQRSAPHLRSGDFGTVTKEIGGGVTRKPASDAVQRSLKKQSGAVLPERSSNPTFEGAIEPTAAGPAPLQKSVIGSDDRVRIRYVTEYPFRTIGRLLIKHGANRGLCTGTLISPRYVLTAAHCLFDTDTHSLADAFPGMDGQDNFPNGYFDASHVTVLAGYEHGQYLEDMGIIRLRQSPGNRLGWLSVGFDDNLSPFVANIVGYPADMPTGTMWRSSCNVDPVDGYPNLFETTCDTYGGSSGSSVYDYDKETRSRVVYGVHVRGGSVNSATRITGPYYCWLQEQMGRRC